MGSAMLHLLKFYTRMSCLVSHGDLTMQVEEAYTYVAFQLSPDNRLMNVYPYRCDTCFYVSYKGRISFGCDSSNMFRPPQVRLENHVTL